MKSAGIVVARGLKNWAEMVAVEEGLSWERLLAREWEGRGATRGQVLVAGDGGKRAGGGWRVVVY